MEVLAQWLMTLHWGVAWGWSNHTLKNNQYNFIILAQNFVIYNGTIRTLTSLQKQKPQRGNLAQRAAHTVSKVQYN